MKDFFKKLAKGIWTFSLKKGWDWLWNKTELDEKAQEATKALGKKIDRVKEESKDVIEATKEVKNQIKDVVDVVKTTSKRRGRPRKKVNKDEK